MFEFYRECTFEGQGVSSTSIVQVFIQLLTLCIASVALFTARKSLNTANENLQGVSRTQSVQAHMNLIALQSEVNKNLINTRIASHKFSKGTEKDDIDLLALEQNNAYIQYISSVDKLASIINTPYFPKQIPESDGKVNLGKWKTEYYERFKETMYFAANFNEDDLVKSQMTQNIAALLEIWDKETAQNTPITQL